MYFLLSRQFIVPCYMPQIKFSSLHNVALSAAYENFIFCLRQKSSTENEKIIYAYLF